MSLSSRSDTSKLRHLLTSITSELDLPFLERRGRKNSHKKNPFDELSDAISELTTREQDLKAAVGIAQMLLETNETLQEKLKKHKSKSEQSQSRVHHFSIELQSLADSLEKAENKAEDLKTALMKAEDLIFVQSQQIQLISEKGKNIEEDEENDRIVELHKKVEEMVRRNEELEKKCEKLMEREKVLENKKKCLEDKVFEAEQSVRRMREKMESQRFRHRSLKSELENTESSKIACENLLKQATSTIQKLKVYAEKLEEERSLLDSRKSERSEPLRHNSSLYSELSILESCEDNEEFLEDSLFWKKTSGSTQLLSLQCCSRTFSITQNSQIQIFAIKSQRKPAPEEYFALATQAVKMNSPYMESICSVPTSQLFEKASKDEIPFHKWHEWISKQLGLIYIDIIYKKNAKFYWTTSAPKKYLVSPS